MSTDPFAEYEQEEAARRAATYTPRTAADSARVQAILDSMPDTDTDTDDEQGA